jgi:hypothetical protein
MSEFPYTPERKYIKRWEKDATPTPEPERTR